MVKLAREKMIRVADVMTPGVVTILAGTPLSEAGVLLAEARVSGAPVIANDGRPLGIITRADLVDPRHRDKHAAVEEAMTRMLFAVRATDHVLSAVKLMAVEGIHRVVVIDAANALVGVVTAMDVLRAIAS